MALFMTPDQVQAIEQKQQYGSTPNMGGLFSGLGESLGNAARRGLGGDDTRSQAIKDAQRIMGLVQGVDFNQPDTIVKAANDLNNAGYTDQAFKFLAAVPPSKKPDEVWSEPYFETRQVGDTTKEFRMQRNQFGQVRNLGEVSDTADAGTGTDLNLPSAWTSDVNMDDVDVVTTMERLANRPEFKSFFGDSDVEDFPFKPLAGQIKSTANQLKSNARAQLVEAYDKKLITRNDFLKAMKSDDEWIAQAFRTYVTGEGLATDISPSLVGGDEPAVSGEVDSSDLQTQLRNISENEAKLKAEADVAARTGKFVAGNPQTGEFRMKGINFSDAAGIFSDLQNKSNDQIREGLESRGFTFTPQLYDWHASNWELMREEPEATKLFMIYADDTDLREATLDKFLDRVEDDPYQWARSQAIFKYLRRAGDSGSKQTSPGSGRRGYFGTK